MLYGEGLTLALVGDMSIARPRSQAPAVPGCAPLTATRASSAATFRNLETSLIDLPNFDGGAYSFAGDMTNISLPEVAAADCGMHQLNCSGVPEVLTLESTTYLADTRNYPEYGPDREDLAELAQTIREARQYADFVLAASQAQLGSLACNLGPGPQLPGAFLQAICRGLLMWAQALAGSPARTI